MYPAPFRYFRPDSLDNAIKLLSELGEGAKPLAGGQTLIPKAADRAHRIGQDRPVLIHRLVARGTVEEGILALQAKKRALADAALGEADRATSLTREELLALLD